MSQAVAMRVSNTRVLANVISKDCDRHALLAHGPQIDACAYCPCLLCIAARSQ